MQYELTLVGVGGLGVGGAGIIVIYSKTFPKGVHGNLGGRYSVWSVASS